MAAAPGRFSRTRSFTGMLIVTVMMACLWPAPADAESPEEAWQQLYGSTVEAYQAGNFASGARFAEEALDLARTAFGERDERTLTSLNNLAFLYQAQGRYDEAEPLFEQALERSRAVLGPDHPSTLQSLKNLAALYNVQGRYGEAESLLVQALERSRAVLGPDHPSTLQSLNNLAFLYQAQGRYGEAEPLYVQFLERNRAVLGPETTPRRSKASTTWPCCTKPRAATARPSRSWCRPWSAAARSLGPTTPRRSYEPRREFRRLQLLSRMEPS